MIVCPTVLFGFLSPYRLSYHRFSHVRPDCLLFWGWYRLHWGERHSEKGLQEGDTARRGKSKKQRQMGQSLVGTFKGRMMSNQQKKHRKNIQVGLVWNSGNWEKNPFKVAGGEECYRSREDKMNGRWGKASELARRKSSVALERAGPRGWWVRKGAQDVLESNLKESRFHSKAAVEIGSLVLPGAIHHLSCLLAPVVEGEHKWRNRGGHRMYRKLFSCSNISSLNFRHSNPSWLCIHLKTKNQKNPI